MTHPLPPSGEVAPAAQKTAQEQATTAAAEPTNNHQLVFFGEDWGRHPSTAQYLARELLLERNITWINSIGLREPSLSVADFNRVAGKVARALPGSANGQATPAGTPQTAAPESAAADPQHMLSPWIVPWHRLAAARAVNKSLFRRQIAGQPQLETAPYSVVTANPASYYLLDELSPVASLYYCADKYAHIAGLNPVLVERFERELLERVDTVAATSLPLVENLSAHHNNVHYLPHGVDFARFNSTLGLQASADTPSSPVVGFVGLLGEHIDFDLIAGCAAALPAVEFVFVGPVEDGITLPQAPNITYRGKVPQEDLPTQLQAMQVCTLPYAMTQRNHYANPTKVREYLAAGRAVVATRQPGLADITGDVSIANTTEEFVSALSAKLAVVAKLDQAELAAHRAAIADPMQNETWAARAQVLIKLL